MNPEITYISDATVNDALDQELRELLSTCYVKPIHVVFRTRRYFREPYPHRWVIRNAQGRLVAHIGVHDKRVESDGRFFRIGGMGEVCVHPDYRGRGYVKAILACIHDWLPGHGFDFAMLFGRPCIYESSGYKRIENLVHGSDEKGWTAVTPMIRPISGVPWPDGEVRLPGPTF